MSLTDIFLPNETEACSLAKTKDIDLAVENLAGKVNTLAIKLGAQGALAISDGLEVQSASIPIDVVDTVGAGDSFDAGFIYGYLNGWPLEKSLKMATVCGALSTRQAGGTTAQASMDEVRQYGAG